MIRDDLLRVCFGIGEHDFERPDLTIEATAGTDVRSHVDLYWRSVAVGDLGVRVAGVAQVCTDPSFRGQNYASALVLAAHGIAHQRGFLYAALFSSHTDFYARLGYRETELATFLVAPLAAIPWPKGSIDTKGEW